MEDEGQAGRKKPLKEFPLDRMLRETERMYDDVLKEVRSRGNDHEGDL